MLYDQYIPVRGVMEWNLGRARQCGAYSKTVAEGQAFRVSSRVTFGFSSSLVSLAQIVSDLMRGAGNSRHEFK